MNDIDERVYKAWLHGFTTGAFKALQCVIVGQATGRTLEQIEGDVIEENSKLVEVSLLVGAYAIESAPRVA